MLISKSMNERFPRNCHADWPLFRGQPKAAAEFLFLGTSGVRPLPLVGRLSPSADKVAEHLIVTADQISPHVVAYSPVFQGWERDVWVSILICLLE